MIRNQNNRSSANRDCMRILHLSDLLISEKDRAGPASYEQLIDQINDQLAPQVYGVAFVVISGNITRDGKPSSFEKATELLRKFADKCLQSRLDRLIIVPGQHDVPNGLSGEPNFQPYTTFYKSLYGKETAVEEREPVPSDGIVQCRHFDTATFLGVSYWSHAKGEQARKRNIKSLQNCKRRIESLAADSNIHYTAVTPTILVSSERLLLVDPLDQYRGFFEEMKAHLHSEWDVTLQLTGSISSLNGIPDQLGLECLCIGTGPQDIIGTPVRAANLITFNGSEWATRAAFEAQPSPSVESQKILTSTTFRCPPASLTWRRFTSIDGDCDRFLPKREPRQVEEIQDPRVRKLLDKVARDRLVILHGFPGSGKGDLVEKIRKAEPRSVVVEIKSSDFNKYIHKILEMIKGSEDEVLLLIRDYYTGSSPAPMSVQNCGTYFQDLIPMLYHFVAKKVQGVIWLISALGFSEERTMGDAFLGASEPLAPLDGRCFRALFQEYSHEVPAIEQHLMSATGRYSEYSRLALEGMRDKFKTKVQEDAVKIDPQACLRLLRESLETSEGVGEESKWFVEKLFRMRAGPRLFDLINSEAKQFLATGELQNGINGVLEIHVDPSKMDLKDVEKAQVFMEIKDLLAFLCDGGVLIDKGDMRYEVPVIAPFVAKSSLEERKNWR